MSSRHHGDFLSCRPMVLLMLLAGLGIALAGPAVAGTYRVVGYVTQWNPIEDRNLDKIDTLIFAFAELKHARVELDAAAAQRLRPILALKTQDPHLRVDISVGGWEAGGFSEAASTAAGRHTFAQTAAQLLQRTGADGLDVDWEYPGHSESGIRSSPADRGDFTLLLKDIRESLDRAGRGDGHVGARHYTLSVAIADGPFVSGIDIPAISRYVDWFNLMTYDFVNSMTPTTGNHTGLYASKWAPAGARTTNRAVHEFLAAGVPRSKIIIGVAFYGRAFAGVRPEHRGLYQPYGHFQGMLPWPELTRNYINKHGYRRYWDARAKAPYLWNAATRTFVTYDDPRSIAAKAAYVRTQHLGGLMYWEQNLDPGGTLLDSIWKGLNPRAH